MGAQDTSSVHARGSTGEESVNTSLRSDRRFMFNLSSDGPLANLSSRGVSTFVKNGKSFGNFVSACTPNWCSKGIERKEPNELRFAIEDGQRCPLVSESDIQVI